MHTLAEADMVDTLAKDFLGLRRRGVAAKAAAVATASFHGVTETRVLCAYERYALCALEFGVAV